MELNLPKGFRLANTPAFTTAEQKAKQELEALIGHDVYSDHLAVLQQAKKDHGMTDEWLEDATMQLDREWCEYVRGVLARYNGVIKGLQDKYTQIQQTNFNHSYTERDHADLQFLQTLIQGIEQIIVEPDGHLTVKLKAYEEIDRLLAKHRQLIEVQGEQRKVS